MSVRIILRRSTSKCIVTRLVKQNVKKQANNLKVLPLFTCRTLHNISPSPQAVKNIYLLDETKENDVSINQVGCNKFTDRTYNCGELRSTNIGEQVTLCGWLEFQRMNKFIVLRDGYGHTQLLIDNKDTDTQKLLSTLAYESIIKIKGTVLARPKDMINKKQATGEIEVLIHTFEVLNKAKDNLPFNLREFQKANEALRMQYRYLDLRFPEMQRNLRVRSQFLMAIRNYLVNDCQFVDVETPTLFKATPGGAQEFIVPTRFPGQVYSLVQSPQQFKQMLMAGAIDRYFQIARCYRDEGSRSDRQPEFTQLDIEMSFTNIEGVMRLVEGLLLNSWPEFLPVLPRTFPRMTYKEAMENFGTDKPDTSFEHMLQNCTEAFRTSPGFTSNNFGAYFLLFREPLNILSKSTKEKFTSLKEKYPETKLIATKVSNVNAWVEKISKLLGEDVRNLEHTFKLQDNSVIFLAYGNKNSALHLLGQIRLDYVNILEKQGHKIRKDGMYPLWITDFPLFEDTSEGLKSAHHPFTAPHFDDLHLLKDSPLQVRAQAYDLVLNGNEVAGGSIRVHNPAMQELIFNILGIEKSFMKHMLDMLLSGCPPHGGIAVGLDRLLSVMLQTSSIRDVIAFPKTFEGRDPLSGAPSPISEHDKKLYHLKIVNHKV